MALRGVLEHGLQLSLLIQILRAAHPTQTLRLFFHQLGAQTALLAPCFLEDKSQLYCMIKFTFASWD